MMPSSQSPGSLHCTRMDVYQYGWLQDYSSTVRDNLNKTSCRGCIEICQSEDCYRAILVQAYLQCLIEDDQCEQCTRGLGWKRVVSFKTVSL